VSSGVKTGVNEELPQAATGPKGDACQRENSYVESISQVEVTMERSEVFYGHWVSFGLAR